MRLLILGLLITSSLARAKAGDIYEWMKGQTITCGVIRITFDEGGRRGARYVFTNGGGQGRFKIKWRTESATLAFDYDEPQDGPFLLKWLQPGSGVLLFDGGKCNYL